MAKSRARQFAELLSGGAEGGGSIAPALVSDQANTSTGYFDVPAGTTAQRPGSPTVGNVRFNSTLDQLEQYTSESGWQGISAPPVLTSTDVTNVDESDTSQVIVLTGANFDATATAVLIDANGATLSPTTVVRNSSSQLTVTYSGGDLISSSDAEPFSVKVINGSGLSAILEGQINFDASPIWSTSSGTLATISDITTGTHATLAATDPEGSSVSFSVVSGSLPSGLSLNSSTGVISGNPADVASNTTSNFTVAASDGTGNAVNRAFSIIVTKTLDGTTSARANTSANALYDLGLRTNGYYYINLGGGAQSIYCILDGSIESGYGYMRVFDERSAVSSGGTIHHFDPTQTDYAAFKNSGGESFVVSSIALSTSGTWNQPAFNNTDIKKYVANAGIGLHSQYSPKTLSTIFNSSWVYSGVETDNYKNFGASNTIVENQLYIFDDNDAGVVGRQVNWPGTPRGLLSFGAGGAYWPDGGRGAYDSNSGAYVISALYLR